MLKLLMKRLNILPHKADITLFFQPTAKWQGKGDDMKFTEEKLQKAVIELFEAEGYSVAGDAND